MCCTFGMLLYSKRWESWFEVMKLHVESIDGSAGNTCIFLPPADGLC